MDMFTYEGSILRSQNKIIDFFDDFSLIVSALIQKTCNTLGNRRLTLDKHNSLVAED